MPDGFRVEIAAAHERADIVLDRPPLNVITMPQRDELRAAFEGARRLPAGAGHRRPRGRRNPPSLPCYSPVYEERLQ